MSKTTPLIKAALSLRGGAGFDVYRQNYLVLYFFIDIGVLNTRKFVGICKALLH